MNFNVSGKNTPLFRWLVVCIALLVPFLLISWKYIQGALGADESGITYIIFIIFLYGFISSIWISIYIGKEYQELKKIRDSRNINKEKKEFINSLAKLVAQLKKALKLISKHY